MSSAPNQSATALALTLALVASGGCRGSASTPPASGGGGATSPDAPGGVGDDSGAAAGPSDLGGVGASSGDLATPLPARELVYVGGYAGAITVLALDPATGALSPVAVTHVSMGTPTAGPSFLCVDRAQQHLYAADESRGRVLGYAIDGATGKLTFVGDAASAAPGPTHLSLDASERWLLVANYGGGVAVHPVLPGGGVGAAVATDQPGANPHAFVGDPSGKFAYAAIAGADAIAEYQLDAKSGALLRLGTLALQRVDGKTLNGEQVGPRHFAFAADGKQVYLAAQADGSFRTLGFAIDTGALTSRAVLQPPLPAGSSSASAAEVALHPSGKHLYGSYYQNVNGADDLIYHFAIAADGSLGQAQAVPSGGAVPRHLSVDPSGRYLLVANMNSNRVGVFRIESDGRPTDLGQRVTVDQPAFVRAYAFAAAR